MYTYIHKKKHIHINMHQDRKRKSDLVRLFVFLPRRSEAALARALLAPRPIYIHKLSYIYTQIVLYIYIKRVTWSGWSPSSPARANQPSHEAPVCVCVCERERERERVCVCVRERDI